MFVCVCVCLRVCVCFGVSAGISRAYLICALSTIVSACLMDMVQIGSLWFGLSSGVHGFLELGLQHGLIEHEVYCTRTAN